MTTSLAPIFKVFSVPTSKSSHQRSSRSACSRLPRYALTSESKDPSVCVVQRIRIVCTDIRTFKASSSACSRKRTFSVLQEFNVHKYFMFKAVKRIRTSFFPLQRCPAQQVEDVTARIQHDQADVNI
ncbi:hypothetical protein DPX16_0686 [Anabarilius grahami]|uniref:Uncharacterized protein n=1 Tax=Anabarilius grahami TaxID=495550 RepID=A0A3N0YSQ5_ANAGA|nr:hypothetical protein DPX16_0686 [Anabarilius grahami]